MARFMDLLQEADPQLHDHLVVINKVSGHEPRQAGWPQAFAASADVLLITNGLRMNACLAQSALADCSPKSPCPTCGVR